jgi:hypothetical protein
LPIIDLDELDLDPTALNLRDLLQGVLDRVISIYESYGMPLPARRYYTLGQPAVDCEQVVVSFAQMYLGPPGDEASMPQRCSMPRTAVMNVLVSRDVPVVGPNGKAPGGDKIQEASEVSAVDAWILMNSLYLLDQWEEEGPFGLGVIATVDVDEPQGGFQTVNMQVTMAVP